MQVSVLTRQKPALQLTLFGHLFCILCSVIHTSTSAHPACMFSSHLLTGGLSSLPPHRPSIIRAFICHQDSRSPCMPLSPSGVCQLADFLFTLLLCYRDSREGSWEGESFLFLRLLSVHLRRFTWHQLISSTCIILFTSFAQYIQTKTNEC